MTRLLEPVQGRVPVTRVHTTLRGIAIIAIPSSYCMQPMKAVFVGSFALWVYVASRNHDRAGTRTRSNQRWEAARYLSEEG